MIFDQEYLMYQDGEKSLQNMKILTFFWEVLPWANSKILIQYKNINIQGK